MTNREDVAKKIRKIYEYNCYEMAIYEIDTIIGTEKSPLFQDFLNRLADLIDPTCRIVYIDESWNSPDVGHIDEWHYECSRCCYELNDEEMDEFEGGVLPFRYCPGCGSRVVRDNHD